MQIFKCKYLNHENEEIIGFCLNQNCQKATQYCYECLTQIHSDHWSDCIRFTTISQYIQQFIQVYNESNEQIKEIINQIKNCFEQIQKQIGQEIKILENLNQKLLNNDYLTFKSQIDIIKQFYSKQKEKQLGIHLSNYNRIINNLIYKNQFQIIEFNKLLNAIINIVPVQTKINTSDGNKIKEMNRLEAKRLFTQGKELFSRQSKDFNSQQLQIQRGIEQI